MDQEIKLIDEKVKAKSEFVERINKAMAGTIIGQKNIIDRLLIAMLCNGHVLVEGVPGLAKTLMVSTISKILGLSYNRIQFTPDLMPSDIIGTEILDENRKFKFVKGPIFANIILADEINRTPPKTQSALLEAMQEKAVTVAGVSYKLEEPFFVLATQNPIEHEGTYPLPEAQLDRFMFNIWLDYPSFEEEIRIVKNTTSHHLSQPTIVMSAEEILFFQELILKIPVPDNVFEYAVNLVSQTRPNTAKGDEWANRYITWGAGPRASQYLIFGAKCHAALNGKYSPDIEDVRAVATAVLRHRIVRNFKAEAEGVRVEDIISHLVK